MVCDLLPIEKLMGSQDTLLYYTSTHCYSTSYHICNTYSRYTRQRHVPMNRNVRTHDGLRF